MLKQRFALMGQVAKDRLFAVLFCDLAKSWKAKYLQLNLEEQVFPYIHT